MSASHTSLSNSAKQALTWSAGLNLFRDILQFVQMLVLARLLDPATYGIAALTSTLIAFIGIPAFQHVIAHVLQVRPDQDVDYQHHFTAGIVINGALFALANIVALVLRFSDPYAQLQPLLHVASITFLLSVPVDMHVKMLERKHDWLRLRNLQFAAIVTSIAAGITMALAGAGVYSLIVPGLLASTLIALDLLVIERWRPTWQWNFDNYREALRFGLNRAGSNTLNSGRALLQNSLITQHGQFVGLGVFGRAEGLANMFCGRISQQATSALYPIITRAEAGSAQFRRISGLALRCVAWVVVPIAAYFSLESAALVTTLYGHQWDAVVPLVPLAMTSGVAISIGAAAYSFLLANNQSRLCLRSDLAAFLLAAGTMVILIPLGIHAYLLGAIVSNTVIAAILLTLLVATHGLAASDVLRALAPPAIASAFATWAAWSVSAGLPSSVPVLAGLLTSWLTFSAAYVLFLRALFRTPLAEMLGYLPGGRTLGRLLNL